MRIPDGLGCGWRDAPAAIATATSAVRFRFSPAGLLGAVTPDRVAVAAIVGRLLAPGWPALLPVCGAGSAARTRPFRGCRVAILLGRPHRATRTMGAWTWRITFSVVVTTLSQLARNAMASTET